MYHMQQLSTLTAIRSTLFSVYLESDRPYHSSLSHYKVAVNVYVHPGSMHAVYYQHIICHLRIYVAYIISIIIVICDLL